jgi:hypothetical protein
MALSIAQGGFRRPICRMRALCTAGGCDCQMEGFGVYLADFKKAATFATKRAVFDAAHGGVVGAVVVVEVDLGHVKLGTRTPCPCGCGQDYVDHPGSWYARGGYDSLYLRDGSMPATRVREWCVADPGRCRVVRVETVTLGVQE